MLVVPPQHSDGDSPAPQATPYDYLEKIFQIPYWIATMNDGSSRSLLRSLVASHKHPAEQQGANAGYRNRYGNTALDEAKISESSELVAAIEEAQTDRLATAAEPTARGSSHLRRANAWQLRGGGVRVEDPARPR
jgi:hypothetical protein